MKAIRIHEFGSPDVMKLEDIPVPEPGENELLIKVYATSVNPVDWKVMQGKNNERYGIELPITMGWDVSGVVEATGGNVHLFKKGDEVYCRPDINKNGSFAAYIVVKEDIAALKPISLSHVEAASVPLAGLTAWQGLFQYGLLQAGQKVLIHGASGGVGSLAVQFAKWKGAHVTGTTSQKNIDFVKDLGADEVIDYEHQKFTALLKDIDLVFDTRGGETQKESIEVIRNGGRLITTVKPEVQDLANEKNIHLEGFMAKSVPADLKEIAGLIDDGKIKPVIAKVMGFENAAEAEKLSEEGHVRGKIVLEVV
jgi:NADPH:quinone reductase-like Zn-dependent oxidoreductase